MKRANKLFVNADFVLWEKPRSQLGIDLRTTESIGAGCVGVGLFIFEPSGKIQHLT